jgi:hypothetical protein
MSCNLGECGMAKKRKQPNGLFGVAQDLAAAKEAKTRFDNLCRRLRVPIKKPDWFRYALVGQKLAWNEPEFTEPLPRRGRPMLQKGSRLDEELLRKVAELQSRDGLIFDRALNEVLKTSDLPPADRTTHRKRLLRLHERKREASRKRLVEALMGQKIREL